MVGLAYHRNGLLPALVPDVVLLLALPDPAPAPAAATAGAGAEAAGRYGVLRAVFGAAFVFRRRRDAPAEVRGRAPGEAVGKAAWGQTHERQIVCVCVCGAGGD